MLFFVLYWDCNLQKVGAQLTPELNSGSIRNQKQTETLCICCPSKYGLFKRERVQRGVSSELYFSCTIVTLIWPMIQKSDTSKLALTHQLKVLSVCRIKGSRQILGNQIGPDKSCMRDFRNR